MLTFLGQQQEWMEAPVHAVVATNFTYPQSNPRLNRGLDFVSLVSKVWNWIATPPNPMKLYPEEAAEVLRYQARRDRARMPDPCLGEASEARPCFFLRNFTGQRELWYVDTEAREITRLAFFVKDEPQHIDLESAPRSPKSQY